MDISQRWNEQRKHHPKIVAKSFGAMIHLHSHKPTQSIRQSTHSQYQSRNKEKFSLSDLILSKSNVLKSISIALIHRHRMAFCWTICSNRCYIKCFDRTIFLIERWCFVFCVCVLFQSKPFNICSAIFAQILFLKPYTEW